MRTGLLALVRPRAGLVMEQELGRLHQRAHREACDRLHTCLGVMHFHGGLC